MSVELRRPAAEDAERFVLGCLLSNPHEFDSVRAMLSGDDFSLRQNRLVWNAIEEMIKAGTEVDDLLVYQRLADQGKAEAAGGLSHLTYLTSGMGQVFNLMPYSRVIREKAERWRVIQASWKLALEAGDESRPLEDVMSAAAKMLEHDASASQGSKTAGEIISEIGLQHLLITPANRMGIPAPLAGLQSILGGFRPGEVTILAAAPAWGKTALGVQVAQSAASDGYPTFVASLEMTNRELMRRMISQRSRTNPYHWPTMDRGMWGEVSAAASEINDLPLHLSDKSAMEAPDIDRAVARVSRETPVKLVMIDYLQLMKGTGNPRDNRNTVLEEISRDLKRMSQQRDLHVLLLSQVSREAVKDNWAMGKPPSLATLRDSGGIEQNADNVVFIWPDRDEMRAAMEDYRQPTVRCDLWVAKQRNGSAGRTSATFVRHHTRFEDVA